ncbi:MAG: TonB-dependent receptor, partial [Acidobacteria bacterium]|nr:TonB-dependent receptor [Acidobacteriota bacterium]
HLRGNHMFKAGFDIRFLNGKTFSYDGTIPEVNFNSTDHDPGFATSMFPGISTANSPVTLSERLINNISGAIGSINQIFYSNAGGTNFEPGQPLHRHYKTQEYDFYVQDTWKMFSNLTLNLGVRYEYSTVPTEHDGLFVLPVGGIQGIFGPTSPEGHFVPGNMTNPRTVNDIMPGGYQLFKPDRNNFAPVISLAWSPFKDDKTSIRIGHRYSYIRENFNLYENIARTNQGLSVSRELIVGSNPDMSRFLRTGVPSISTPDFILPLSMAVQFQGSSTTDIAGFDPDLRTPYVKEWTASIQHEIFKNTVLEARYVGNTGVKLIRVHDVNEVNIHAYDPDSGQTFLEAFLLARENLANGLNIRINNPLFARIFTNNSTASAVTTPIRNGEPGELADVISRVSVSGINGRFLLNSGLPINFFRPNPDVRGAYIAANGSRSSFHALQVEIRRRFRSGMSFQANYQFGKSLSDYTGTSTNQSAFITQKDPDYEYQMRNRVHQVKANFIYEIPFGKGKQFLNTTDWKNAFVGGWQIGGILRWESGYPLTINSGHGSVNSAARSSGNTVNLVSNLSLSELRKMLGVRDINGTLYYFDPSFADNFELPQPGQLGSFRRTAFNGPGYFRTDLSVIKRTAITERQNVEFRAELFNAFNNVNFDTPNMSFKSANFGVISDVRGGTLGQPRIIQFGLRYNF